MIGTALKEGRDGELASVLVLVEPSRFRLASLDVKLVSLVARPTFTYSGLGGRGVVFHDVGVTAGRGTQSVGPHRQAGSSVEWGAGVGG